MVKDISRIDCSVAALTNKVGFEGPDVAPMSIMDHVESLLTHAGTVESKVSAVNTRVDTVEASAQVGVACDVKINKWIAAFGVDFNLLVQKCLDVVLARVFLRIQPLESFFASIGQSGVSQSSSLLLEPPVLGENVLSRIEDLERALAAGGPSTFPLNTSTVVVSWVGIFNFGFCA